MPKNITHIILNPCRFRASGRNGSSYNPSTLTISYNGVITVSISIDNGTSYQEIDSCSCSHSESTQLDPGKSHSNTSYFNYSSYIYYDTNFITHIKFAWTFSSAVIRIAAGTSGLNIANEIYAFNLN